MTENSFVEPSPATWMNKGRLQIFHELFSGSTLEILALSGDFRSVLRYWIRHQVFLDIKGDESVWSELVQADELHLLREDWLQKYSLENYCLNSKLLDTKLIVSRACKKWAFMKWHYKIESLYLEKKELLDQASCRLIRNSNKRLLIEIYHRFLAEEATFETLAFEYGEGPERLQAGMIPLQSILKMPFGLDKILPTLEPGKVMPPARFGQGFALVQLLVWKPAVLDDRMRVDLLQLEFTRWLEAVASHLQKQLLPPLKSN